jgi:hypothetical protein
VADEDDGGDDVDNNQSDVDTAEDVAEQSTSDGISRTNNKTQRKKRKGDESGMDATGGRPRRRSAGRRVGRGRGGAEAEGAAAERVVGGDLARNNLDDD